MGILIESINYRNRANDNKIKLYTKHNFTNEEQEKTKSFIKRMTDFLEKVRGKEVEEFYYSLEATIKYIEDIGYITYRNSGKDNCEIYFYGDTEEEAFIDAMIDYEFDINSEYVLDNRVKYKEEYIKRFGNANVTKRNYHETFFFAELSIQDFRKYYGDNIPKRIITNYERYLQEVEGISYKYDYLSNQFIKSEEKENKTGIKR